MSAPLNFRAFTVQSNKTAENATILNSGGSQDCHSFYQCGQNTKINCIISGPMQKSMGGDQSQDSCQIKVNVNFINNMF